VALDAWPPKKWREYRGYLEPGFRIAVLGALVIVGVAPALNLSGTPPQE
jgi:hypothetical protein